MKNDMASSARKGVYVWIIVLAGICLLVLIPAVWCWYVPLKAFRPTRAPDSFPDAEIIHNAEAKLGLSTRMAQDGMQIGEPYLGDTSQ